MILSDSHCHVDSRWKPELLAKMLEQARVKHVDIAVGMGMNIEYSAETIRLAQSHNEVLAAVGIHPWNAISPTNEVRKRLSELARQEQVVAIGEIGLDYTRGPETKEIQKELLICEFSIARETGLPVNIHCEEAHKDMMDILRQGVNSGIRGTIHGFSGDLAELHDWLDLGFYVSIGIRGFVSNEIPSLPAVVREIPLDRLLTETDSTGIALQPTGPADVLSVVEKLASLRGTTPEEIANTATANLKHLLKL